MPSIRKHFTRAAANAGAKIFIPDENGKPTEDWLIIYGQDSDAFREAQKRMREQIVTAMEKSGPDFVNSPEYVKLREELSDGLRYTLVKDWCFEEEVTIENVKSLFTEAPHIGQLVDTTAGKRSLFVLDSPKPSETSLDSSSNSISQPAKVQA